MSPRPFYEAECSPYLSNDEVAFFVRLPEARSVSVIGSFNGWRKDATPLRKLDTGWWVSEKIRLPAPARYLYRFFVNGENFFDDPLNVNKTQNKHGPATYFDTWMDIPGVAAQLKGIHEALLLNPPGTGNLWIRDMCTIFLDDYLQQPHVNRSANVREFLTTRIRHAIEEISNTQIRDGIRLWHIYNDGYIIQTPQTCFGIDVVTTRHVWNLAWDIPDDIPLRLSELMDFLLITHEHSDHHDYEIVSTMIRLGKTVIVPGKSRHKFHPDAIPIEAGSENHLQGQKIVPMGGTHVYDNGRGIYNLVYDILTDTNVRLLHTGDHDYTESWISTRTPDVLIPKFDGVSPKYLNDKVLEVLFSTSQAGLIVPGHINELAHYPMAGRSSYREASRQFQKCTVPYQILLWGESYFYS